MIGEPNKPDDVRPDNQIIARRPARSDKSAVNIDSFCSSAFHG